MSTVLVYLGLIVVGLRWNTLPEDVQFFKDVLTLGAKYGASIFKNLCKKKMSEFTDSAQSYPRPPRTQVYETSEHNSSTSLSKETTPQENCDDESEQSEESENETSDEESEEEQEETDQDQGSTKEE